MAIQGKNFKMLWSATPATKAGEAITEAELRAPTAASYCPVVSLSMTPSKEKIEFKTRCGKSALTGVESVTANISYIPNEATDDFHLALRTAYQTDAKIFIADILGTGLSDGVGYAGNWRIYSAPQANDVNGVWTVSIELTGEIGETGFLND